MTRPDEDFRAAVLAALGAAPERIEPGRLHRFSVNGKRGDTAGWCRLFPDGRAGVFGDWRSGRLSVWTAQRRSTMTPSQRHALARQVQQAAAERREAQAEDWSREALRLARLLEQCRPVPVDGSGGDPVTLYLRRRLALAPSEPLQVPAALRLHPSLQYWHDGEFVGVWPAMVAVLTSPAGEPVALHRTWLTADGRKAPTPWAVKKLSKSAGPVMGGCIRLADPADGLLGIAEGIETALAARCASGVPTVAAYSADALAAWQWPRGLSRLVIFADHDEAGAQAAQQLRHRAVRSGISVNLVTPSQRGEDWCDVWAKRHEQEVAA
jgi:phage/plasmid primase-like uncharacterized protein